MKTRGEEEMLALVISFAQADDHIRVVVLNGSRVNPNVKGDIFQDYDVIYFVTDVEPFRDEARIVSHFGVPVVVQKVEDQVYRPGSGDGRYTYNIQFVDGNRIDMGFVAIEEMERRPADSLTRVLLDKDEILPELDEPSEQSYFLTEPTQHWYDDCCNTFCFTFGSHIPKIFWRRRLPLLKSHISRLREDLVLMLGWYVGVTKGFDRSLGSEARNLVDHLEPDDWQEFERTYAGAAYDDIFESLLVIHQMFVRTAQIVGRHYGYRFPAQDSDGVLAFLKHVRQLSPDAESIY
ncbi:MAG: aminoglycoside 6-adenylyltransferase [Gemmatimonadetes bacterium]|jgi:aminoglycoside 6-adenylyltransferase|nr:aminoglycoside 6-adenylyltransferase [Gemmatimonadota bacterium]